MQKDKRLKQKEDATSAEGFSKTNVVLKSTKASPSAKDRISNAGHPSFRRVISLGLSRVFVSRWRRTRARRQTTAPQTSQLNLLRAQEESVNLEVQKISRGNHV